MKTPSALKTVVGALALAGSIAFFAAPTASAIETTPEQFAACRITDDPYIQQLAEDLTLDEGDLVTLVNNFRVDNGLAPISVSSELARAAVIATHDSALRGYTPADHVDSLGRDVGERLDACGVWNYSSYAEINFYQTGGEVSQSADDAFYWWLSSPGHRAILLDPNLTEMGIALGYIGEIGQVQDTNSAHWTIVFTG